MRPTLALPLVLALAGTAALLSGCGGAPDDRYFPLEAGHRWHYRITTTFEDPAVQPEVEDTVIRSLGAGTWGGARAWHRVSDTGAGYWLRADETGIYRVASEGPLKPQPRADSPVAWVLKKPYQAGTTWDSRTVPYVLQRRNEQPRELRYLDRYRDLPIHWRIEQVGQSVQVPAGRFSGCLVVAGTAEVYQYSEELLAYRNTPLTAREWYCPGPGLVKQERVEHAASKFLLGGTVVLELVNWQ